MVMSHLCDWNLCWLVSSDYQTHFFYFWKVEKVLLFPFLSNTQTNGRWAQSKNHNSMCCLQIRLAPKISLSWAIPSHQTFVRNVRGWYDEVKRRIKKENNVLWEGRTTRPESHAFYLGVFRVSFSFSEVLKDL